MTNPLQGTAESRPEPVLTAQLVTFATAVIGTLVAFGVPLNDDQQSAVLVLVGALTTLSALGAAWWARRRVTPLSDPRNAAGRRLVVEGGAHS